MIPPSHYLSFFILVLAVACSPTTSTQNGEADTIETNSQLSQQLIGGWRNASLQIQLNSANGMEGSEVLKYDESNWEEHFGMKPARTYFQEGGAYYTEYRDLNDSIFQTARGKWRLEGDSLFMEEEDMTYRYRLRIKDKEGEFTARVDGDEDGVADDNYVEVQKRIE